jgi:hypothetical protein
MTMKSKAALTGVAALFALSALSSQAHAGAGPGPTEVIFDPGFNMGPPSCGGEGGLTPGEVLGHGGAAEAAERTYDVDRSTVGPEGSGGPSTINGVQYVLAAGPEGEGCGITPLRIQEG